MLQEKKLLAKAGYTIEVGFVDTYDNRFDCTTVNFKTKEEAQEFMGLLSILKNYYLESDQVKNALLVDWYERSTVLFKDEDKFDKKQEDYVEEVISIINCDLNDYFCLTSDQIRVEWADLTYTPKPVYVQVIDTI